MHAWALRQHPDHLQCVASGSFIIRGQFGIMCHNQQNARSFPRVHTWEVVIIHYFQEWMAPLPPLSGPSPPQIPHQETKNTPSHPNLDKFLGISLLQLFIFYMMTILYATLSSINSEHFASRHTHNQLKISPVFPSYFESLCITHRAFY